MGNLVNVENLITEAKTKGINFGKGNPYNRLRYYTKMGWLPHMLRKRDSLNNTIMGHYPKNALETILMIEKLKKQGFANEEITKKLQAKDKLQNIYAFIVSPEIRNKVVTYLTLGILLIIFANELEIIHLGKNKSSLFVQNTQTQPNQILDNGTQTIAKNQTDAFVKSNLVTGKSKIYITFTNNYSPATRFWVSRLDRNSGFVVELDAPVFEDVDFNWWLTN